MDDTQNEHSFFLCLYDGAYLKVLSLRPERCEVVKLRILQVIFFVCAIYIWYTYFEAP